MYVYFYMEIYVETSTSKERWGWETYLLPDPSFDGQY